MAQTDLRPQTERVRRVRKDYDREELSRPRSGVGRTKEADDHFNKPLKAARSQAEITRVRQGWALMSLALAQLAGTTVLILHAFGIL